MPSSVYGLGLGARSSAIPRSASSVTLSGGGRAGRRRRRGRRRTRGRGRPRRTTTGSATRSRVARTSRARPARQPSRLDHAAAEVAEHVAPAQVGQPSVAHDHAAGDRAVAAAVQALDHGPDVAWCGLARRVAAAPLERAPAEVRALAAAAAHEVDLLDLVLADVADREVARAAVEGEAPWVAQAVAVDLAARAGAARRTGSSAAPGSAGRRSGAGRCAGSSQQRAEVLPVAARAVLVPAPAAVAEPDVEQAVGAEEHEAAVVVGLWLLLGQHQPRRARIRAVGARALVLDHPRVAVVVGVVDVEAPAVGVVGREGHRQQSLLAAAVGQRADVQERRGQLAAAAHDHDPAALLDHEHAPPVAVRRGDVQGRLEAADLGEPQAAARRRLRLRLRGRGRGRVAVAVAAGSRSAVSRAAAPGRRRARRSRAAGRRAVAVAESSAAIFPTAIPTRMTRPLGPFSRSRATSAPNSRSSSAAGSAVRPVCTGEGCTIVLAGAVSQWKRSDWSQARRRCPPSSRALGHRHQRLQLGAHLGRVAVRRQRGEQRLVERDARAEEAQRPAEQHHAGVERLAALDARDDAQHRVLERLSARAHRPPPPIRAAPSSRAARWPP